MYVYYYILDIYNYTLSVHQEIVHQSRQVHLESGYISYSWANRSAVESSDSVSGSSSLTGGEYGVSLPCTMISLSLRATMSLSSSLTMIVTSLRATMSLSSSLTIYNIILYRVKLDMGIVNMCLLSVAHFLIYVWFWRLSL